METAHWVTCWSKAQRGMGLTKNLFQSHQSVKVKVSKGNNFTFRFATFYDQFPVTIANILCESEKEHVPVLIQYRETYEILPQTTCVSDPVEFVEPVEELTISYDIVASHIPCSGVPIHSYDEIESEHDVVYLLCGIDVLTEHIKGCVSVFGDSISEQGFWVKHVKIWMKEKGYIVLNHGISGNRFLREMNYVEIDEKHLALFQDTSLSKEQPLVGKYHSISLENLCFGKAGIDRYESDVLSCQGLCAVLFALGVNDLYQPGSFCATLDELPTLKQFQTGYEAMKQNGIPRLNLAITPCMGSESFNTDKEQLRREINEYLRSVESSIGFVEITEGICEEGSKWMDGYHQGDYLHPNAKGGEAIAKQVIQEMETIWNTGL